MTEIKNIIFDWDNTLFPFKEKYWELAHRQLFSEQLGPFTDQDSTVSWRNTMNLMNCFGHKSIKEK